MPRSKEIRKYPQEYTEIVQAVGERQQLIELPIADQATQKRLRGQWYGFVYALRRAQTRWKEQQVKIQREKDQLGKTLTMEDEELRHYANMALLCDKVVIELTPTHIRWVPLQNTWGSQMLREKLAANPPKETAAPANLLEDAAASQARVLAALGMTPDAQPRQQTTSADLSPEAIARINKYRGN
jgi:hypothetical protein